MFRLFYTHRYRTALGIGMLLAAAGCSKPHSEEAPLTDAISKIVGFTLPADTTILAYRHQHDEKDGKEASQCSQLWVVQAATSFSGPDRRVHQTRVKSPFASLKLLVEQLTEGRVTVEAAEGVACQCIQWQNGEAICRLRQVHARSGWVAVLEAVSPH